MAMWREAGMGFGRLIAYYGVAASSLIALRFALKPPREVFRKMLHMACVLSIFVLLLGFSTWYLAAGAALTFAIVIYPIIRLAERYPKAMDLLIQRKSGEIRHSLMLVFFMMAALIAALWGLQGPQWKPVIAAAVLGWGLGDAAAALVGKALGRRPVRLPLADPKKTLEGSLAMAATAFAAVLVTLAVGTALPWHGCLLAALLAALAAAYVELISGAGMDTITVPFAIALVLYAMISLLLRRGWVL